MRPVSEWTKEALCRDQPDTLFFTGVGQNPTAARRLCAMCPVQEDCLYYALIYDELGVWGGFSEDERKGLKHLKSKLIKEAKDLGLFEIRVPLDEPLHLSLEDQILARHKELGMSGPSSVYPPVGSLDFGPIPEPW
jgi:WhiB family transcriptional regulator, redox-sensing transcriptional regulator